MTTEESQLEKIYKDTANTAYFIAMKYVKNEDVANDILQEVYISVYEHLNHYDEGNLQGWINTITANKCKDYLKKKKPVLFSDMGDDEDDYTLDIADDSVEFSPDKQVDYTETKRLVMDIINSLPEEQNLCIMMFYYQEMSVKEIAEYFECSGGTIKSRLNYARKNIKERVVELEKSGTKLHIVPLFGFIAWLLASESKETAYAQTVQSQELLKTVKKNVHVTPLKKMPLSSRAVIITGSVVICAGVAVGGIAAYKNSQETDQVEDYVQDQVDYHADADIEKDDVVLETTEEDSEIAVEDTIGINEESVQAYADLLSNESELREYGFGSTMVSDEEDFYSNIYVNLFDMDLDGVPELFVEYSGLINSDSKVCVFTYGDSGVIMLGDAGAYMIPYFLDDGEIMTNDVHMGAERIVYKLENQQLVQQKSFWDELVASPDRYKIDGETVTKEQYLTELESYSGKIIKYGEMHQVASFIDRDTEEIKVILENMVNNDRNVEHNSEVQRSIEEEAENNF